MACPTCGYTMDCLGSAPWLFWCHRCGTLKDATTQTTASTAPDLVQRCRDFAERMPKEAAFGRWSDWHRLGIAEAIDPPARRRKGP